MASGLRSPLNGFLLGLVVGVLAITLWTAFGPEPSSQVDESVVHTSEADAQSLVQHWERMRLGTWAIESTFTRRTASGLTSVDSIFEAQLPPDYVRKSSSGVDARLAGRRYACGTLPDGTATVCSDGGTDVGHSERVRREIADLRRSVIGPHRVYDVQSLSGGCFRVFARPAPVVPEWGNRAEFCFDDRTSARVKSEFHRPVGTDSIVAIEVRSRPDPEDLRIPAPVR